jgi:hypothetical protein
VAIKVLANSGVAKEEMDENHVLQINNIGAIMSTSETLSTPESDAKISK